MTDLDLTENDYFDGILDANDIDNLVVFTTDWTTETLISQIRKESIDINPYFQRRDAWTTERKSKYIESLILGLPVPQVVLAEVRKGRYLVLDGKQRLLTLMQFFGISQDAKSRFRLKGCDILTSLDGKSYADLESDPNLEKNLTSLLNQSIRSVIIRNWTEKRILELVFIRLNTGSVPLSPHELRLALLPGPFSSYVDDVSYTCDEVHRLLGVSGADFRMRDSELITRFFSLKLNISNYQGDLSDFLDKSTLRYNEQWDSNEGIIKAAFIEFNEGLALIFRIFGEKACRKWVNGEYEKRFNRAILDSLIFYFSDVGVRHMCVGHEMEVEDTFKHLCETSQDYMDAVGATTKKTTAVYNRLFLWGEALAGCIGSSVRLPTMTGSKIEY